VGKKNTINPGATLTRLRPALERSFSVDESRIQKIEARRPGDVFQQEVARQAGRKRPPIARRFRPGPAAGPHSTKSPKKRRNRVLNHPSVPRTPGLAASLLVPQSPTGFSRSTSICGASLEQLPTVRVHADSSLTLRGVAGRVLPLFGRGAALVGSTTAKFCYLLRKVPFSSQIQISPVRRKLAHQAYCNRHLPRRPFASPACPASNTGPPPAVFRRTRPAPLAIQGGRAEMHTSRRTFHVGPVLVRRKVAKRKPPGSSQVLPVEVDQHHPESCSPVGHPAHRTGRPFFSGAHASPFRSAWSKQALLRV